MQFLEHFGWYYQQMNLECFYVFTLKTLHSPRSFFCPRPLGLIRKRSAFWAARVVQFIPAHELTETTAPGHYRLRLAAAIFELSTHLQTLSIYCLVREKLHVLLTDQ